MFDIHDPRIIWVSSGADESGDGTAENPFGSLDAALGAARPGYTIVLKKGTYAGNTTIELSGDIDEPITIAAETEGAAEVTGGCWFLYDASDLIISGIVWSGSNFGAVSVMGACLRNRFEKLHFVNCGTRDTTSSTMYFGGSGGSCNIVENCVFERTAAGEPVPSPAPDRMVIGIMVSEGDLDHGAPITTHLFRRNRIVNYDYGMLIGTAGATTGLYGHIVEYNRLERCAVEGILVKCGDTRVRGNLVQNCRTNAIVIAAGTGSVADDNRIVDCGNGILVSGADHTVNNNCVIRCSGSGVQARGAHKALPLLDLAAAGNLFIENNTLVDCATGVRIGPGTSGIVRGNLFAGKGETVVIESPGSYQIEGRFPPLWLAVDNMAPSAARPFAGVVPGAISFDKRADEDYTNNSGFGAAGWVLRPETFDPELNADFDAGALGCTGTDDDDDDVPPDDDVPDDQSGDAGSFMERLFNPDGEYEARS